jgi:mannose-1-phosphate guanylyltransferase
MTDHSYAVIMAGGGGTRLWPLSRKSQPKQSLSFGRARTLFQMTVDRLDGLIPLERILVVTVADQVEMLHGQVPDLPDENFLVEPMPRGTASVVGLAAKTLQLRDSQAEMIVLAADHFIDNVPYFQRTIKAGLAAAQQGNLVTLGITPTFASTGYGYIQFGDRIGESEGLDIFRAVKFKEKPTQGVAQQFLESGDHAWNSGMFLWTVEQILAEMQRQMPDLSAKLDEIGCAWNSAQREQVMQAVWPTIRNETIDFGIMEKAEHVAVIPASELQWNDVGSWESIFDVLAADEQGNIVVGSEHLGVETNNTLIFSEVPGRLIATIGLKDLIVIDTGSAVLICPRDQAQKVRQVVDRLKQEGHTRYL